MSTQLWELPPNIGATGNDWIHALSEVTSVDLAIRLNTTSGFHSFFRAANEETSVGNLYRALLSSDTVRQAVMERIEELSQLEIDRRYENPNDTALAVLLWLILFAAPDYAPLAADLVDRAPQCWYAKKLARRILTPSPLQSTGSSTKEEQRASPAEAFSGEASGEARVSTSLASRHGWRWHLGEINIKQPSARNEAVEIVN